MKFFILINLSFLLIFSFNVCYAKKAIYPSCSKTTLGYHNDSDNAYFEETILQGIDAKTFQFLSKEINYINTHINAHVKDKNGVYSLGVSFRLSEQNCLNPIVKITKLKGIKDPLTFEVLQQYRSALYGKDKFFIYDLKYSSHTFIINETRNINFDTLKAIPKYKVVIKDLITRKVIDSYEIQQGKLSLEQLLATYPKDKYFTKTYSHQGPYYTDGKAVFYHFRTVAGADAESFLCVWCDSDIAIASDKNYIYISDYWNEERRRIKINGMLVPFDRNYVNDNSHIINSNRQVIEGVDIKSLRRLNKHFFIDKDFVYDNRFTRLDTDRDSFTLLSSDEYQSYGKDDAHIYHSNSESILFTDVDYDSFIALNRNSKGVTRWHSQAYGKDKNHVFYKNTVIPEADPKTFKLSTCVSNRGQNYRDFAYDKNHYYSHGEILDIIEEKLKNCAQVLSY
jgi:hypothetical protein